MTNSEWVQETETDMAKARIHSDVERLKPIDGVPLTETDRRTAETVATSLLEKQGLIYTRISASDNGGIGITYSCDKAIGIGASYLKVIRSVLRKLVGVVVLKYTSGSSC